MQDFKQHLIGSVFSVIVKPNASKTEFLGFDEGRKALRFSVAAAPDNNKANEELLKFLKKELGPCKIISGKTSKYKRLRIVK